VKYADEILMAYVDGELDATLQAEIAVAVQNDPALARRVEQQRALRAKVAGAFATVLNQPVPERLTRAALPNRGNVLQFPARPARAPAAPWRAREWVAMAASLMLGALISWRVLVPGEGAPIVAGKDALVAHGELARALEHQLASEQQGKETVLVGLTFKARDGNYCRSFELRSTRTAGLACRAGSDWQVTTTDSSQPPQGQLQQASSALSPAILRAIEARADGAALDAEAERSAQESGWKAPPVTDR
jgi:hypothetical protein